MRGFHLDMSRIVWAGFWGERRQQALARFRRELLQTHELFGDSIEDLATFRPRGPRPRPGRRPDTAA